MISPIRIELKRRPDLQSMQTPAPAGAGLESETFRVCDVSDGRNADAIGTHARSHQSGCGGLCLPMASFRQPEGAASSVNRRFGSSRRASCRLAPILRGVSSPKHKSRMRN